MRIAIPTADGRLCPHFGHCEKFAFVDVDEESKKILGTETAEPPGHEPGVLPKWLNEQNVKIIIAGGMGQRAQQFFTGFGISVIVGVQGGSPEEIAQAYLQEELAPGANLCDH